MHCVQCVHCAVCTFFKFNFNFSDKTFGAYLNPNDIEPWNKPMWTVENETRTTFTCFVMNLKR
jgi:hypothetical protein